MPRGVVVEPPTWGALRITARPHRRVHCKHRRSTRQVRSQQLPQSLGRHLAMAQRGIQAAMTATVERLQRQVRQRHQRLGHQQRITQLKPRIRPASRTAVQRGAEALHDLQPWHSRSDWRTLPQAATTHLRALGRTREHRAVAVPRRPTPTRQVKSEAQEEPRWGSKGMAHGVCFRRHPWLARRNRPP